MDMLQRGIESKGLRPLLLSHMEGSHVADDVGALVMDECCEAVGSVIREHARALQEQVARRLGVTLIEEEDFARRTRQ